MYEYEYETEALLEGEGEWEGEYEGELEGEEFLGAVARRGWGWLTRPGSPQRRFALGAARAAVQRGSQALGGYVGGRLGQQNLGQQVGGVIGSGLSSLLPQQEFEWESEFEGEWEGEEFVNPLRRVYADAMMEHMAHAATQARSEAEAEAFIGALAPLAARLLPAAAPTIMRALPGLVGGLSAATRVLRRHPSARPLVRTLPTVMRRTAAQLAQRATQGRPLSPQAAVRTLAQQTARVIASPQQSRQAVRRSQVVDRRLHQMAGQRSR
jgi:hypothetical protein